jgi:hypothetical protein
MCKFIIRKGQNAVTQEIKVSSTYNKKTRPPYMLHHTLHLSVRNQLSNEITENVSTVMAYRKIHLEGLTKTMEKLNGLWALN